MNDMTLELLMNVIEDDKISAEELEAILKQKEASMQRKELLKKHTTPITQLPSGRYYTRINGKKVERSTREAIEDAIVAVARKNDDTFANAFDNFLRARKMTVEETTWSRDVYFFNTYLKDSPLARKPVKNITLDDGYEFLEYCLKLNPTMKKKYWSNIKGLLNSYIRYFLDRGIIAVNPLVNLKPKNDLFIPAKKVRDCDTIFSHNEQVKIVELAEDDAEASGSAIPLGIVILFNLGLRVGELCALKWSDIESGIRGTFIHVQREMVTNMTDAGKNNGFRVLDHCKSPAGDRRLILNEKAKKTFELIHKMNADSGLPTSQDDYIFMRIWRRKLMTCSSRCFDPRLRKYCKNAGMQVIKSCHDIRRTALTNLFNAGMPLKKLQEYAGHSTLKQTMDYIRISDDDIDIIPYLNSLDLGNSNVYAFPQSQKTSVL